MIRLGFVTRFRETGPETAWLLRALLDSVTAYVPPDVRQTFVAVNDSGPLVHVRPVLDHATAAHGVTLLSPKAQRPAFRYPLHGEADNRDTAAGPIGALVNGFRWLKEQGCTHAFSLDSDAMLLRPLPWDGIMALAAAPNVFAVSDFYGGPGTREVRRPELIGCPHSSCCLVNLTVPLPVERDEWYQWFLANVKARRASAYFPFYRESYAFHLGWGTLRHTLGRARLDLDGVSRDAYGNVPESPGYLERSAGNAWAGWLTTRESGDAFVRVLGERCDRTPLDEPVIFTPEDFACPPS